MKILIQHKICDNSPTCGGIDACQTGALYFDDINGKISFDESKCIGCGACVRGCPVMAIHMAKTHADEERLQAEFAKDTRQAKDLFVDRYGGDVIETELTELNDMIPTIKNTLGFTVLELNSDDDIHCLLNSIPMHDLFNNIEYKHIKVFNPDDLLLNEFDISELPALILFKNGKSLGAIQGYFENSDTEKSFLINKIQTLLK